MESDVAQQWARGEKVKLWEVSVTERSSLIEPFTTLTSRLTQPQSKSAFPLPGRKSKGTTSNDIWAQIGNFSEVGRVSRLILRQHEPFEAAIAGAVRGAAVVVGLDGPSSLDSYRLSMFPSFSEAVARASPIIDFRRLCMKYLHYVDVSEDNIYYVLPYITL